MNIFICQTPFQGFYARRIIEHIKSTSSKEQQFVIYHSGFEDVFDTQDVELVNVDTEQGFYTSYSRFKNAITAIANLKYSTDDINFFIPHTGGLIANFIYYSKAFNKNEKVFINLYYEGVLYLYDYKEPLKSFHYKRFILGLLCGFVYTRNEVILPYNAKSIYKIYTPIKKYTQGPIEKLVDLEFNKQKSTKNKAKAHLVLGGPVTFINELYTEAINEILAGHQDINSSDLEIYYKGHGSFKTHNRHFQNVFATISEARNIKYTELSLLSPIEDLMENVSPCCIYSYYSSALLNLRLMGYDDIRIICYLSDKEKVEPVILQALTEFNIVTNQINSKNEY